MESPVHFAPHELATDQRSSTPKSSRLHNRTLFQANESAIIDADHSFSSTDRTRIKRRLFHKESPVVSSSAKHDNRVLVDATMTPSRMDRQSAKLSSQPTASVDVVEDPENQTWTVHQRNAFFDAVKECGSDCVRIAQRMKFLLAASLGKRARSRKVSDVRKYFQHVVKIVSDIMGIHGRSDEAFLRYMVINFGEWTRLNPHQKMPSSDLNDSRRIRSLLKELICNGEAVFPLGKKLPNGEKTKINQKIYTPNAPALRQLHWADDLHKVPSVITIRLRPRTAATLFNVRRSGHSPVLSINFNASRSLKHLFDALRRLWHIERTEKKYLSAELPELTLRPPPDSRLTFPEVMPDFRVLLHPHKLGWYSYDRFARRFPNNDVTGGIKAESNEDMGDFGRFDEDAMFYSENGSDAEDSDGEADGTLVRPVERPIFQPMKQYPEFFDENRQVAWSSARHLHVPLPELYMIAGFDGHLTLDYDWIIPDETSLLFTAALFQSTKPSLKFYEALQQPPPASFFEKTPKKPNPGSHPLGQTTDAAPAAFITEDITNSPSMFQASPQPAGEEAVAIQSSGWGTEQVDSGVGAAREEGATLSEFLVMPSQDQLQSLVADGQAGGVTASGSTGIFNQFPNTMELVYIGGQMMLKVPQEALNQSGATQTLADSLQISSCFLQVNQHSVHSRNSHSQSPLVADQQQYSLPFSSLPTTPTPPAVSSAGRSDARSRTGKRATPTAPAAKKSARGRPPKSAQPQCRNIRPHPTPPGQDTGSGSYSR